MEKANVTIRLEKDKIAMLDRFAEAVHRDRSYLIKEAIDGYLGMKQWQVEEINKAIAEADAGHFVSDSDMKALFTKWMQ